MAPLMDDNSGAGAAQSGQSGAAAPNDFQVRAPQVSLPKGGGAIRDIGEKFATNPTTGTGSMSVPLPTSQGRSAFGPQLSLSYDSGSGNSPFGLGWSLSLQSITRKTDLGLPRYADAEESDVFVLSGAEDLVPVLAQDESGTWVRAPTVSRLVGGRTYLVSLYRPRVEGLFARIERWTNVIDGADVLWRSISKDNITTWYGKTRESRIADPADPAHIFSWLICESHDDKGNVLVYRYKAENSERVHPNLPNERNRSVATRSANRYPKSIRYGNRRPYLPLMSANEPWPTPPGSSDSDASHDWLFEVVLD